MAGPGAESAQRNELAAALITSPFNRRMEIPMARIGTFTPTADGFTGRLHLLARDVDLVLVPAGPKTSDKAPDYRVLRAGDDGGEVGAGWKHTGERAGPYVSVVLDDPTLPRPIHANLFWSEGDGAVHFLQWTRPSRRGDQGPGG